MSFRSVKGQLYFDDDDGDNDDDFFSTCAYSIRHSSNVLLWLTTYYILHTFVPP